MITLTPRLIAPVKMSPIVVFLVTVLFPVSAFTDTLLFAVASLFVTTFRTFAALLVLSLVEFDPVVVFVLVGSATMFVGAVSATSPVPPDNVCTPAVLPGAKTELEAFTTLTVPLMSPVDNPPTFVLDVRVLLPVLRFSPALLFVVALLLFETVDCCEPL